jgi:hypothetical protein
MLKLLVLMWYRRTALLLLLQKRSWCSILVPLMLTVLARLLTVLAWFLLARLLTVLQPLNHLSYRCAMMLLLLLLLRRWPAR